MSQHAAPSPAVQKPADELDRATMAIAWVVVVGAIMAILDATVVNVAINRLSLEFGSPLSTIQWTVTGYMLALATVIPLTGWASHRFGTKRLYMLSLLLFMAGSALAGLAWSAESLIGFRVLQGFGGGMIMPAGMAILTQAAGPARVGRVMAIVGVPMLLGPIMGPILGGWLVDNASWRWIFFINVPIGIAALALAQRVLLRDVPEPGHRLDVRGLAMLSPGLAALIYGLAQTAERGGFEGAAAVAPTLAGAALILAFVRHAARANDPLLDVRLFTERPMAAAAATMTLFSMAFFGAMLLLPLYFQVVRGEEAFATGLLLAPQGIGAMITMPLAGILTDRFGPGRFVVAGLAVIMGAMYMLTQVTDQTSYYSIGATLFVLGMGMGMTMMPTMTAALQRLRPSAVPRGTTALNIIQQVGGAVGTAVLSVLLAGAMSDRLPAPQGSGDAGGGLAAAQAVPPELFAKVAPLIAAAFAETFWWALAGIVIAVVPALLLPMRRLTLAPSDGGSDAAEEDADATSAPVVVLH